MNDKITRSMATGGKNSSTQHHEVFDMTLVDDDDDDDDCNGNNNDGQNVDDRSNRNNQKCISNESHNISNKNDHDMDDPILNNNSNDMALVVSDPTSDAPQTKSSNSPSTTASRLRPVRAAAPKFQTVGHSSGSLATLDPKHSRFSTFFKIPGGKNNTTTTFINPAIQQLVQWAEFEIQCDPFRGMSNVQTYQQSPWRFCRGRSVAQIARKSSGVFSTTDSTVQNLIESVFQCHCPSLITWAQSRKITSNFNGRCNGTGTVSGRGHATTTTATSSTNTTTTTITTAKSSKRKRKRSSATDAECNAGVIRPDWLFSCTCDANPFCLVSLGGVVNEALQERWKEFQFDAATSSSERENDSDNNDIIVIAPKSANAGVVNVDDEVVIPETLQCVYTPRTRQELQDIRKHMTVPRESIRRYLSKLLPSDDHVQQCITAISQWHRSLIFDNPNDPLPQSEETVLLSLPPGIENLGATCYLNTQFQCLAQNRVFATGLLSWSSQGNDKMTGVVRLFQQLLTQSLLGMRTTLNTIEFSDALGLDHHEQQDPNEFSRLFLEKLHGALQNNSSLARLLPDLFEGIISYETICLECKSTSTRQETFMDLNLPIVHPPSVTGQISLLERLFTSRKSEDITCVQTCLDSYCSDEVLDGDNQYFCSSCNAKRDAKRIFRFRQLPPVLNIQLSRYVFDRVALMKKKLTDKVLLPLSIQVQAHSSRASQSHKYVLVAVMRHQGKSAYSGHYVAEAMDWQSGQWFEFNDEKVQHLEDGPSCAFDPSASPTEDDCSLIVGSTDAYNMYYVQESFLSEQVILFSREHQDHPTDTMKAERDALYNRLSRQCLDDAKMWEKLQQRRKRINNEMLATLFSPKSSTPSDWVWVPTAQLQAFLSCQREGSNALESGIDLSVQLCPHGKLHPRTARKGKVLSRLMFEAYVDIQQEDELPATFKPPDMLCSECASEYISELSSKLQTFQAIMRLYESLDPKNDNFDLQMKPSELPESEDEKVAYIVSRKFISNFRARVAKFIKNITSSIEGGVRKTSDVDINNASASTEGLDALDISAVLKSENNSGSTEEQDDLIVNQSITCDHGNCSVSSKRSIRYIRWSDWIDISTLFPSAIEHKRKRYLVTSSDRGDGLSCPVCHMQRNTANSKSNMILALIKSFDSLEACDMEEEEILSKGPGETTYRILHEDDLGNWKKFLAAFKNRLLKGESSVDAETRKIIQPPVPWDSNAILSLDTNCESVETLRLCNLLKSCIRPIACRKHKRPIRAALFYETDTIRDRPSQFLHRNYCFVTEATYFALQANWISLARILDTEAELRSPDMIVDVDTDINWYHPSCSIIGASAEFSPYTFTQSNETSTRFFLQTNCCTDSDCERAFLSWSKTDQVLRGPDVPSPSQASGMVCGSAADDPISIDCDQESSQTTDFVSVRVYEAQKNCSLDVILEDIASLTGMGETSTSDNIQTLRRSTRKKKARFPFGMINSENNITISLKSNVAALRLLLYERCTHGQPFHISHNLHLLIPITDGQTNIDNNRTVFPSHLVVELTLAVSGDTLEDIICRELSIATDDLSILGNSIALVRRGDADPSANQIPKENLLDHMVSLAETAASTTAKVSNTNKKKPRVERGFTGTFLSSRLSPEKDATDPSRTKTAMDAVKCSDDFASDRSGASFVIESNESTTSLPVAEPPPSNHEKSNSERIISRIGVQWRGINEQTQR